MPKSAVTNVLFCGRGGQGVLAAAEVLGWAALFSGYHVKKSEIHGMAQRGGSVESHLRFGKVVFSPLIPKGEVDYLVAFDRGERQRLKNFLKPKGGRDFLSALENAEEELGDQRYLNIFILAWLSRYLAIKEKDWLKAIARVFADKADKQENLKIFLKTRSGGDDLE